MEGQEEALTGMPPPRLLEAVWEGDVEALLERDTLAQEEGEGV